MQVHYIMQPVGFPGTRTIAKMSHGKLIKWHYITRHPVYIYICNGLIYNFFRVQLRLYELQLPFNLINHTSCIFLFLVKNAKCKYYWTAAICVDNALEWSYAPSQQCSRYPPAPLLMRLVSLSYKTI